MEKSISKRGVRRVVAAFRNNQPDTFGYTGPRHRGWVIVVCVLLSVLLWLFFSMRRTTSLDLTLPTRVVNLPPGESLAIPPPQSVSFRIRGEGLSLLPLYYNRPTIDIDASQVGVDFEANVPGFSDNIRIESASPPDYFPQLEASVTVKIPIELVADIDNASTHEFIV
ncbi:MAG: hypothetical protein HKN13_08280, partial [Rhodothermales bacterium]|nr:hypothetical protein [Rhodothermales bacterium]